MSDEDDDEDEPVTRRIENDLFVEVHSIETWKECELVLAMQQSCLRAIWLHNRNRLTGSIESERSSMASFSEKIRNQFLLTVNSKLIRE
jgi:hypothetical protein